MYDLAAKSRHAMKAKIERLIDPHPGKVDSSDYGPEETDMHAERKTNVKRPINPRAYKRGGKVTGAPEGREPMRNAGKTQRKKRADGGAAWDKEMRAKPASSNSGNAKTRGEAIDRRVGMLRERGHGDLHEKARSMPEGREKNRYNRAGDLGKKYFQEKERPKMDKFGFGPGYKKGGKVHDDAAEDKKLIDKIVKPEARRDARKDGGKADWSEEAKAAAKAMGPQPNRTGRVRISGDGRHQVDKHGNRAPDYRPATPAEGLARKLQREGPDRTPRGRSQWEEMMAALPRSGGRRKAENNPYGGRKITSEREYADGGSVKGGRNFRDRMRDAALSKGSQIGPGGSHYKRRPGASQDVVSENNGQKSLWGKTGKWNVEHGGAAFPEWKEKAGPIPRKRGGKVHDDAAEDKKLIDKIVKPEARRDARADGGGNWIAEATKNKGGLHRALGVPASEKIPEKKMAKAEHSKNPHVRKMANLAETLKGMHREAHASGGKVGGYHVVDEWGHVRHRAKTERGAQAGLERIAARGQDRKGATPLRTIKISDPEKYGVNQHPNMMTEDTRKAYGFKPDQYGPRAGRASGGRTKGKTNVNVIIATGPQPGAAPMPGAMPPMGAGPVTPPMPNAAMPGTSPMPGGPLPAGLAAGAPAAMPMPRKRGGRTSYPIDTGSGGARARLDKKDAY